MSARRHELGDLLDGRRSTGVWGAAGAVGILGILVAYFTYAHLYLAVTASEWPPPGTPALPVLRPAILVAVILLAAAAALRAGRPLRARDDQLPLAGLLGAGAVLGLAAVAGGAWMLAELGLAGTERAHDASLLVLHAWAGVAALAGVLINVVAAYEAARLGHHPWVEAAAAVAGVWWAGVALVWLAVGGVAYGWPQLLGGSG